MSIERRSDGPRVALEANAVIKLDLTGSAINSRIVNASQKGMLVVMPDARPVGTRIRVLAVKCAFADFHVPIGKLVPQKVENLSPGFAILECIEQTLCVGD